MTDIVERLREQASFDGVPNSLESEAADEIERLMAEHDDYVIRANANVCELNREIERLTAALEIIAGRRQCIDNLMSNVDVACAALDGGKP